MSENRSTTSSTSRAVTLRTPAPSSFAGSISVSLSPSLSVSLFHLTLCNCVKKMKKKRRRIVKKGEEGRKKKRKMERKVKGAWGNRKKKKGGRRKLDTVGHVYLCTWPLVFHMQPATLSSRHVASWSCSYSNHYCRHAANYSIFCSGTLDSNNVVIKLEEPLIIF
jgi:hypothetical protein